MERPKIATTGSAAAAAASAAAAAASAAAADKRKKSEGKDIRKISALRNVTFHCLTVTFKCHKRAHFLIKKKETHNKFDEKKIIHD